MNNPFKQYPFCMVSEGMIYKAETPRTKSCGNNVFLKSWTYKKGMRVSLLG